MVLVDFQIMSLCEQGLLTPYDQSLVNPASVDLRIGNTAEIETESGWQRIKLDDYSADAPLRVFPHEFMLVATLEVLSIPNNICAEFKLKSSRAREGWNHAFAAFVDPGYALLKIYNKQQQQRIFFLARMTKRRYFFLALEFRNKSNTKRLQSFCLQNQHLAYLKLFCHHFEAVYLCMKKSISLLTG